MMDKKHQEVYKTRLQAQMIELRGIVSRIEEDGRSADEDATQDPADKASNSYTKELLFSQSNSERNILSLVEEALERMESGEYGECIECGGPMHPKRLEAVPWARHCIPCQEKQEQGLL
jgi:DnaK suppressor protein